MLSGKIDTLVSRAPEMVRSRVDVREILGGRAGGEAEVEVLTRKRAGGGEALLLWLLAGSNDHVLRVNSHVRIQAYSCRHAILRQGVQDTHLQDCRREHPLSGNRRSTGSRSNATRRSLILRTQHQK